MVRISKNHKKTLFRAGIISSIFVGVIVLSSVHDASSQASPLNCGWNSDSGCFGSGSSTCPAAPTPCSQICDFEIDLFHGDNWSAPLNTVCTGSNSPVINAHLVISINGVGYTLVNGNLNLGTNGKTPSLSLNPCIPLSGATGAQIKILSFHGAVEAKGAPCSATQCAEYTLDPGTYKFVLDGCHMIVELGAFINTDRNNNPICHDCSDCN